MARNLKVAVIGAGVSGLLAARELRREGHRVVVFEKADKIGGTWAYNPQVESDPLGLNPNRNIVHSSLYCSLRTNFPRELMEFSDYPFIIRKNTAPITFPGHEEVLKFLNNFARDFELIEPIRFNAEVLRVERVSLEDNEWVVESRTRTDAELINSAEEIFDAVVVCNGHCTQPRLAHLPGIKKWPGKQIHSHNYRVPEPFRDQVVVMIGDGPSANDISVEIARVAKEVHLSSRSPEIKVSKLEIYENLWQHSKIDHCYENGEVAFEDGALVSADVILHCTGYKYDFPFLRTNGIVTVDDNCVGPLYKHVFPPQLAPGLSFVGLPYQTLLFPMLELQAKWVAHVLSGKVLLPSKEEMLVDVKKQYRAMEEKGVPRHHTHRLLDVFEYLDWLAAEVGLPPVDDRLKEIFRYFVRTYLTSQFGSFRETYVASFSQQVSQILYEGCGSNL